jgi:hypothetical protein
VIAYFAAQKPVKKEFVLNHRGKPPNMSDETEFLECLSIEDVYQGRLGDCYLVATIMGILKNHELLAFVVPADNATRKNMETGAYHFRMWSLCEWYDVVVDDYLPTRLGKDLIFSKNATFRNEFWVPLIEKATAKLYTLQT